MVGGLFYASPESSDSGDALLYRCERPFQQFANVSAYNKNLGAAPVMISR